MTRLERLRERLDERLLVTSLVNVAYLTGFESSNAALLVDPERGTTLYTDFRYLEVAQAVPGVEVVRGTRTLVQGIGQELDGRLAFEADAVSYADYELLSAGALQLVPTRGAVEELRAVKSDDEVERIRRAARAADFAFQALLAETWVGRSERELAWRLLQLMHANGVDELSFETIVVAGPNGALPHGRPSDDGIPERTLVTVDWGARLDGYCSDCTRTLATGALSKELRRMYDVCLEAQLTALEGIRPGMSGVEADKLARDVIDEAGYGEYFGHGLGHGVGVDIHEAPRLTRESVDTLEVGNVLTIEPGIYVPGVGGVRIEDLGVLREDGVEVLSSLPKELAFVG